MKAKTMINNNDFKSLFGFERSVCLSIEQDLSDSQLAVIRQLVDFGVDEVYFSTNEYKSYPAVLLKKITAFSEETIREISNIQQKLWNYQKILFLYVYSDTEVRIYNCAAKPFVRRLNIDYSEKLSELEIAKVDINDKQSLNELISLFSSVAIDSGLVWTDPRASEIRHKINLQKRVDRYLVDSLMRTTEKLLSIGLIDIVIIHKIILRSLFLLYLEDRGATNKEFYSEIDKGAKGYFDILKNVNATYRLYKKLDEKFNGNVFSIIPNEQAKVTKEHLELIRKCFINGYEEDGQGELFEDWRLFDFRIIRIELLSEIYEQFLEMSNPQGKRSAGAYYTPISLVELILDEVLPVNRDCIDYNVKILDPACGSGIFLVESYKRLLQRYKNANGKEPSDFEELKGILQNNIYGIEKDSQAIIVAAFSLYLALVDNLDPKTLWISTKLPCLINDRRYNDSNKQGHNLFCRDAIEESPEIQNIAFDLVVGNPPFGTENKSKGVILSKSIRDYCIRYNFAKEMVLPFLHKSVEFSPKGRIALIFNAKILTNTNRTYQTFRQWLFGECYIEKLYNFSILRNAPKNFGGQLFGSAIGPIGVVIYRKTKPGIIANDEKIIYCAPKTYVKSNVIEGVVIDSSDVKYLSREECRKPDSKIWKIAMWGGEGDKHLIRRLSKMPKMSQYLLDKDMKYGVGLQFLDTSTNKVIENREIPQAYIRPERICRYYTESIEDITAGLTFASRQLYSKYYQVSVNHISKISAFRRTGAVNAYEAPHILIKEGLQEWNICASFIEKKCSFNSKVIGIYGTDSSILKGLVCFLNSSLVQYYIFFCSPTIGIEREEIKKTDIENIPFILNDNDLKYLAQVYEKYIKQNTVVNNLTEMESEIDDYILDRYNVSEYDKFLIEDFLKITKKLMMKDTEQISKCVQVEEVHSYIEVLCSSLNEFISSQQIVANGTMFSFNNYTPLVIVKIVFESSCREIVHSAVSVRKELEEINSYLWAKKSGSVYFRKKLNYYVDNAVYLIRPNRQYYWTKSTALDDASGLIIDVLNMEVEA